jgi:hypothetical protein
MFLFKFIGAIVAVVVLVPVVVVVCLPYVLLVSLVDKDDYWPSVWWRIKRVASTTADLAGIIGASGAG